MLSVLMFVMVMCYFMQTVIQGKIAGIIYEDMVKNNDNHNVDPYNPYGPNLSKEAMGEDVCMYIYMYVCMYVYM
jgi:hypothetical protein